jgi:hypothetical protein
VKRIRSIVDGQAAFTVAIDQQEKLWYTFAGMTADAADGGGSFRVPFRRIHLKTGDYSLIGHESEITVERKSLADLYKTIGRERERFERELARMAPFEFAAVMIEAGWEEILTRPPEHTQTKPKTIYRSVIAWQQRYPAIQWWAVEGRELAEVTTFRILERFWKEKQNPTAKGAAA